MAQSSHTTFLEYHRGLAESHLEIQHHPQKRKRFFATDFQEFSAAHTEIDSPVMLLLEIRGNTESQHSDEITVKMAGGFVLLVPNMYGEEDFDAEQQCFDDALRIGLEVIAKINEDMKSGCGELMQYFDTSQVRFHQVGPMEQKFFGYAFNYPIEFHSHVEHNPDQWQ